MLLGLQLYLVLLNDSSFLEKRANTLARLVLALEWLRMLMLALALAVGLVMGRVGTRTRVHFRPGSEIAGPAPVPSLFF